MSQALIALLFLWQSQATFAWDGYHEPAGQSATRELQRLILEKKYPEAQKFLYQIIQQPDASVFFKYLSRLYDALPASAIPALKSQSLLDSMQLSFEWISAFKVQKARVELKAQARGELLDLTITSLATGADILSLSRDCPDKTRTTGEFICQSQFREPWALQVEGIYALKVTTTKETIKDRFILSQRDMNTTHAFLEQPADMASIKGRDMSYRITTKGVMATANLPAAETKFEVRKADNTNLLKEYSLPPAEPEMRGKLELPGTGQLHFTFKHSKVHALQPIKVQSRSETRIMVIAE